MNFECIKQIGHGTYGVVYKAKIPGTSKYVALKQISLNEGDGIPCTALREISLLKSLHHNNIVTLQDVFHSKNHLTLVLEFCDVDLRKYIKLKKGSPLSLAEIKSFSYQILDGIKYLHSKNIVHRDIKPQNLLIKNSEEIKICDFGLSCLLSVPHEKLSMDVVTQWYRAPEIMLKDPSYGCESDIWSIGCIIFEMATGKPLFPCSNDDEHIKRIFEIFGTPDTYGWEDALNLPGYPYKFKKMRGIEINTFLIGCDYKLRDLIKQLLVVNPRKRATAKEAMNHCFFDDFRGIQI